MHIRKTILWKACKWIYHKLRINRIMDIKRTIPWKFCKWIYYTIYYFPKYDHKIGGHLKHFGRDFPEKTFYVMRRAGSTGLLSDHIFATNNISYALTKGYVPVVNMENYSIHHKEKRPIDVGGVVTSNAWEYFFEQPCGYSLKDIKSAKNVILSDMLDCMLDYEYSIIGRGLDTFDSTGISRYHTFVSQYCRINQKTMEYINKGKELLFDGKDNILGISYRATSYIGAKGHHIPASMDQMIERISLVFYKENFDYLYICTEVQEMVDELYKSFPKDKIICLARERFREDNWRLALESIYLEKRAPYQLELDYLTDMYLLSQCDGLIASNYTSGLPFALGINNNKYRYKYIFDLGIN